MEFTTDMFIDLAYKSGFLIAYTLAMIAVWSVAEVALGRFRRGS